MRSVGLSQQKASYVADLSCKVNEGTVDLRELGRLEDLLEAARRGGFAEVWLETNSVLTVATSLYEKYGFQPVDPDDLRPRCDQAYLLRLN